MFDKILKEVREQEVGKLTLLREQTEKKKEGIYQLKMEREKCLHRTLYEEELQACRTERAALEKENHEHRLKQKEAEQQMELVRRRWELDQTACEQQFTARQKDIEQQITLAKERVAEIDRLLDNRQGSFYEWLSQNCQGRYHWQGRGRETGFVQQGTEASVCSGCRSRLFLWH